MERNREKTAVVLGQALVGGQRANFRIFAHGYIQVCDVDNSENLMATCDHSEREQEIGSVGRHVNTVLSRGG